MLGLSRFTNARGADRITELFRTITLDTRFSSLAQSRGARRQGPRPSS